MEDYREKISQNTEILENSGKTINVIRSTVVEIENNGIEILDKLHQQKSIIDNTTENVENINEKMQNSKSILKRMFIRRTIVLLLIVIALLIFMGCIVIVIMIEQSSQSNSGSGKNN